MHFNRLIGAGAAVGAFASTGSLAFADTRLRYIWWGNPDRDKRTLAAVDLYKTKDSAVSINPETYAWADYWPKLATQAAGGNLADVMQMDYRYIFEWARRGQLADLTPHLGNELHMENFDKNQLDSGKVDDKLYGISMGANSVALVYNVDQVQGAQDRASRLDQVDLRRLRQARQGRAAAPADGLYFTANRGDVEAAVEMFMRSRGKALYTTDGQLAYDVERHRRLLEHLEADAGRRRHAAARRPGARRLRRAGKDDADHRQRDHRLHQLQPACCPAEAQQGRA